jgi:hypothetical protein
MMKRILYLIAVLLISAGLTSCLDDNVISRSEGNSGGLGGQDQGRGGSMAKFSISKTNLFLINEHSLVVYDISAPSAPSEINKLEVDFGIETVFTLKDKLFIGSDDGVYIYDISDPRNILYLSHYQHITACDPVVANDTLAFATLNSWSQCRWQNGANQLDVIDIRNVVNPTQLSALPMHSPKGLAIDSNYVFVCNSDQGVVIFDFSDPKNLKQVGGIAGIHAYDIILQKKILYLIGEDGLFQYDYQNADQIELLSNMLF